MIESETCHLVYVAKVESVKEGEVRNCEKK